MSSRAKRGICCSLALAADRLLGVARAVRALLLLSPRQLAYWVSRVQRARLQISFCERQRADPSKNPFPLPLATRSPAFDFGTHIPQANADASCSENQGVVDS